MSPCTQVIQFLYVVNNFVSDLECEAFIEASKGKLATIYCYKPRSSIFNMKVERVIIAG